MCIVRQLRSLTNSFWGDAVCAAGAGPRPIPYSELTASRLAVAFRVAQMPQIRAGVANLGQKLSTENGAMNGVRSFQSHLPVDNMMSVRQEAYELTAQVSSRSDAAGAMVVSRVRRPGVQRCGGHYCRVQVHELARLYAISCVACPAFSR